MRCCLINPNSTESMTAEMVAAARAAASEGTVVEGVTAEHAPPTIEGYRADVLAATEVVDIVSERTADYDSFVIACFGDPGLHAAREVADAPVVGIAEASFQLALSLGRRFSILTNTEADIGEMEDLVLRYGLGERSAGVRAAGLGVAEADDDRGSAATAYLAAGRAAIEQDHAVVILVGCGPLLGLRQHLETELGAPVIEAVPAAVVVAEGLVRLGLRTSKVGAFRRRDGVAAA